MVVQSAKNGNSGRGELVELLIQLGPLDKLSGREDERHNPTARDRGSGRNAVQTGLEITPAFGANHLLGDFTLVKKQQRRNGAYAVLGSERLMVVNVHFADFHPAIIFVGQFVEERRDHFAWPAPLGPEINEHGYRRLQNLLRKIFRREGDD